MAATVNARDLILQAASPRVLPVNLPTNVKVPTEQVDGLPELALNSKVLFLKTTSQVFRVPKGGGAVSPASTTLTPVLRNISGTVNWQVTSGTATLNINGDGSRTLTYANMATDTVTIKVSVTEGATEYSESVTIVKLREGTDGETTINAILTNETHTIPADSTGVPTSYSGASTQMLIFVGLNDSTNSWNFTRSDSIGVTSSINGNTVTITEMQAAYSGAYIDITASRAGYASITRRMSVSKAKNGSNGGKGDNGLRGSITAYASGSSWDNNTATSAIITLPTSNSMLRVGDTVTISNGTNFAKTKYWSGFDWTDLGVVIDGNLLVRGTVSADAVYGGTFGGASIAIASSAGGWILNAGFNGTVVGYRQLNGYNINAGNLADPNMPAVQGEGVGGSIGGIRGKSNTSSGLVGAGSGKAFHAESGTSGPFTGSHDVAILNGSQIEPGDIVIDKKLLLRCDWSNTFFEVERSSVSGQSGVLGVYTRSMGPLAEYKFLASVHEDTIVDDFGNEVGPLTSAYDGFKYDYFVGEVNAVGEGQMNVCGLGGNIQRGDLIVTSSMPGKGMRQLDDVVRKYTVAKARESVSFDSPNEVKKIACIYMCG